MWWGEKEGRAPKERRMTAVISEPPLAGEGQTEQCVTAKSGSNLLSAHAHGPPSPKRYRSPRGWVWQAREREIHMATITGSCTTSKATWSIQSTSLSVIFPLFWPVKRPRKASMQCWMPV